MNKLASQMAMATLWAIVFASTAFPAYLGSDYGDTSVREVIPVRPPDIVRPIPPPPARNPVTDLLGRVEVGAPYRYLGLTVFPLLITRNRVSQDIRTFDEAIRRDWIVVREKGDAEVSGVQVRNDSRHLILLMAGEIIAGGRQNRVIMADVLLPPDSGFIEVPVYCVEQERWRGKSDRFESPSSLVHQALRKGAAAGESQAGIWKEIDARADRIGISSPTRNYQDIYEDKRVSRQIDDCLSHFRDFCRRETVGAVAVVGNHIISCDVFCDPALFSQLWPKLNRSYALEEVTLPEQDRVLRPGRKGKLTAGDIRNWLDSVQQADYRYGQTPGAGRILNISGNVTGNALIWNDETVHAGIFPGVQVLPMQSKRAIE